MNSFYMTVKGLMNNLNSVENPLVTPPDGRNLAQFSGALFCFVIYLPKANQGRLIMS